MISGFDALAICGPTSAGKSEIAVRVAVELGGEIVNADSRQVYRDIPIGSGSPTPALLRAVPHHLFGFVDPCERYGAGAYVRDAAATIGAIAVRGRLPIVVGGTGFYIDALRGSMPLDRPYADAAVRERVRREAATHPHEILRAWLDAIAPEESNRTPLGDRYRTMRSLEAVLAARSAVMPDRGRAPTMRLRIAILDLPAEALRRRIGARVRAMFDGGLAPEALAVQARCADAPALTGLGYAEALAWQRGEASRDEAVSLAIARTRRYAKRQRTWFRRMRDARSVDASDAARAVAAIIAYARETSPAA